MNELTNLGIRRLFLVKGCKRKGDNMGTLSPLYKCLSCKVLNIPAKDLKPDEKGVLKQCPLCGAPAVEQCSKDHICTCAITTHGGIAFCPHCGNLICPTCGSHDVAAVSRITGYLQDVAGWNAGKAQELKERKRYDIGSIISVE